MEFRYTAQDHQKNTISGVLEGTDKFSVARALRAQGLFPLSAEENVPIISFSVGAVFDRIFGGISLQEKITFTHNLSGMLSAGLSLSRALEIQMKQTKNQKLSIVLEGLATTVNQGGMFSDGLAKYPKVFSPLFISMVRAGEESGNLSGILGEIGTSLEKSYTLSRQIKGAMMYPTIIISVMVLIGALMMIFVVPTLTKIFSDMGTALPVATQLIIAVSNFASGHAILFLGGILGIGFGIFFFFRSPKTARFSDKMILTLPGISTIVKEVNSARTARTLSSLLSAGVEMTHAIAITKNVIQNIYYKEVLERAELAVQKGESLSVILKSETTLYPTMFGEMVSVGEETGALTKMLADLAKYYEDEVDAKTKNLSVIIEPVLMVFIGGAVGFFAISIISPIYSLMSNVQ